MSAVDQECLRETVYEGHIGALDYAEIDVIGENNITNVGILSGATNTRTADFFPIIIPDFSETMFLRQSDLDGKCLKSNCARKRKYPVIKPEYCAIHFFWRYSCSECLCYKSNDTLKCNHCEKGSSIYCCRCLSGRPKPKAKFPIKKPRLCLKDFQDIFPHPVLTYLNATICCFCLQFTVSGTYLVKHQLFGCRECVSDITVKKLAETVNLGPTRIKIVIDYLFLPLPIGTELYNTELYNKNDLPPPTTWVITNNENNSYILERKPKLVGIDPEVIDFSDVDNDKMTTKSKWQLVNRK